MNTKRSKFNAQRRRNRLYAQTIEDAREADTRESRHLRNLSDRRKIIAGLELWPDEHERYRAVLKLRMESPTFQPKEIPVSPSHEEALRRNLRVYFDADTRTVRQIEGYLLAKLGSLGQWTAAVDPDSPLEQTSVAIAVGLGAGLSGDEMAEHLESTFWGAEEEAA